MKPTPTTRRVGRLALAAFFAAFAAASASASTWTYSAGAKTITDGQWTLKVSSFDKATGMLTFASQASKGGWTDPNNASSGILDLRHPLVITDSSDDSSTTVSSISIGKSFFEATDVVELYCDIIGKMLGKNDSSEFQGCSKMTRIEIGGAAETMTGLFLNRCPKLKTIKLNFPNMRNIGNINRQSLLGVSTTPNAIDITTVATPGVTNVYGSAFSHSYWKGDIAFTNIMAIGWGAFNNASLTNVCLAGTLASLPAKVFGGSTITNVVLDLTNLVTVAADAFSRQSKIRRVEFVSAPKDMGQVTNIVAAANNANEPQNLIIYVSKTQWTQSEDETYDAENNPTGFFIPKKDFTAEEKSLVQSDESLAKAFGILYTGDKRKAFFVHKQSVHDKVRGVFMFIR